MARRHEQAIALDAAKANVGATLGQGDEPYRLPGGIENLHPVLLRIAHAPPAPQVAVDVDAEAVRSAARLGVDEGPLVRESGATIDNIEDLDDARSQSGLDHVELRLIG